MQTNEDNLRQMYKANEDRRTMIKTDEAGLGQMKLDKDR